MKLNGTDNDPLRRLADDFINSTRVSASHRHRDPFEWIYRKLKGSEKCLKQATNVVSQLKHFSVATIVLLLSVLGAAKFIRFEATDLHPATEGVTAQQLTLVPSISIKTFSELPLPSPAVAKLSRPIKSTSARDPLVATRSRSNARPAAAANHSSESLARMTFPRGVPMGFDYDEYGRLRGRALQPGEKISGPQKSRAAETLPSIQKSFIQSR